MELTEKNPKPVVCLIIEDFQEGRKILLQKRIKNVKYKGIWELPQGKIQLTEDILSSAKRELKEETNLQLVKISKKHSILNESILDSNICQFKPILVSLDLTLGFVGMGLVIDAGGILKDTEEASSHAFFSENEIKELLKNGLVFPMNIPIIKEYFNNNNYLTESYIKQNEIAYNSLAKEYEERNDSYVNNDKRLLKPFFERIESNFENHINILDLGCGSGLNLKMFTERGYSAIGIDISSEMLKVARKVCPEALLINDNFLEDNLFEESFEAVLSKASIHNFTKPDAMKALNKVYRILKDKGVLFIATTVSERPSEGFYLKKDYSSSLARYRKFWTPDELKGAITKTGFRITQSFYNDNDTWDKKWFNIICEK